MKTFFAWWYRISLPRRSPDQSPADRERSRYARLTTNFTLLIVIITVLFTPVSFLNAYNPAAPVIASAGLACVLLALVFNKLGLNIVGASLIVLSSIINVTGTMITNPLDPTLVPIFSTLVIPLVLAGALMPPVAVLIVGAFNSVLIILIGIFQTHTADYNAMLQKGLISISLVLPVMLQMVVALVIYVIMRNLITTIRRADRAEEIITLQAEIAEFEQNRVNEQQQLEEGIAVIAQVHLEIARGNLNSRVPLGSENVLWQIAVPLNNLLNRVQQWKGAVDQLEYIQTKVKEATQEIEEGRRFRRPVSFKRRTGTVIDPLLAEINYLSEQITPKPPTYL